MARRTMREDAVSPVIAVILMVAITVVLAAVVYVWVSGFGTTGTEMARSMSVVTDGTSANSNATFTVSSASPTLKWDEIALNLDGRSLGYANLTAGAPTDYRWCVWNGNGYCEASPSGYVNAGARLYVQKTGSLSGTKLTIVDTLANSAMVTLTVR